MITQEYIKKILDYNFITGKWKWRTNKAPNTKVGSLAGSLTTRGYRQIMIDGVGHSAARLVFLYVEGSLPTNQVDHINRMRDDNQWNNLRDVTNRENSLNRDVSNPFTGVGWDKRTNKWIAYSSQIKGKRIGLGRFNTHLAACYARHHWEINCD